MPPQIGLEEIKKIIADQLAVDPKKIVLDTKLDSDLGADSLERALLVVEFEEEFGIDFGDEDILEKATVGDALKFINELLKKK